MEDPVKQMNNKKTKVLIVDDSAVVRKILSRMLNSDPDIDVVGTASDPYIARGKIKKLHPDVLTLDVEMPRMDGITFLANLMRLHPMPVVMVSSLTDKGAEVTMDALELGAIDFVTKPKIDISHQFEDYAEEIISKVKTAAMARVENLSRRSISSPGNGQAADAVNTGLAKLASRKRFKTTDSIIAIGASTGGTEAIHKIIVDMPPTTPGIVITQHIPERFSYIFAKRLNRDSVMTVFEATDGQHIVPGHVYVAPGNRHLSVQRDGARYVCHLDDGPLVNRHKPAVDVLFNSVAENVGRNAIGVILTGMGADGARGMKVMQDSGAKTIAQDENSSVVWGMPGEAVKSGGVDEILPLSKIASALHEMNH
jgi:two-component system, chemotaxis family, protein-glutamate methylesterase/glutaminase